MFRGWVQLQVWRAEDDLRSRSSGACLFSPLWGRFFNLTALQLDFRLWLTGQWVRRDQLISTSHPTMAEISRVQHCTQVFNRPWGLKPGLLLCETSAYQLTEFSLQPLNYYFFKSNELVLGILGLQPLLRPWHFTFPHPAWMPNLRSTQTMQLQCMYQYSQWSSDV